MARKLEAVPFEDANWNKARGECSLCGCDITSATSKYCWVCYKKCLKHCPECTNLDGIVLRKYQRHQGMPSDLVDGKQVVRKCSRCEVPHSDERRLKCEQCNNERVVFVLPKEKEDGSSQSEA